MPWDIQLHAPNSVRCSWNTQWHIPASTCTETHAMKTEAKNHTSPQIHKPMQLRHYASVWKFCPWNKNHNHTHTGSEAKNHTRPHRRIYGFINSNSTVIHSQHSTNENRCPATQTSWSKAQTKLLGSTNQSHHKMKQNSVLYIYAQLKGWFLYNSSQKAALALKFMATHGKMPTYFRFITCPVVWSLA